MTSRRVHEWAWGDVGCRTVCGNVRDVDRAEVVSDLGAVPSYRRCRNCERMRAAIGASSRGAPSEPTPIAEVEIGEGEGELTEREREILEHATGWHSRWPLYRNHFCAGETHDDWLTIQGLRERGLMGVSREPSALSGGDYVFCATATGIAALKRGAKGQRPARSRQPTGERVT